MSCDGGKWECEYCTYKNWPSAIRCTMCRSCKPPKLIEEGISEPRADPTWDSGKEPLLIDTSSGNKSDRLLDSASGVVGGRAASSKATVKNALNASQRLKPTTPTRLLEEPIPSDKSKDRLEGADGAASVGVGDGSPLLSWSCKTCTFLNPDFMNSCLQCSAARPISDALSSASINDDSNKKLWNEMKILKISDEAANVESPRVEPTSSELPVSRIGSSINSAAAIPYPEGASKVVNSVQPKNCNVNEQKWSCHMCTYDNWPRSFKCIMCGSTHQEMENEAISLSGNNRAAHTKSHLGIPKNKRYGQELQSDSLYHREDIDALFLEACRGVVEGKIEAVEEYLAAGGDPTRQLTETEVEILARPSAFDPGFTLVHLALSDHTAPVVKRVPPLSAPTIALEIRRHALSSIRARKGSFQCQHSIEITTFTLPSEVDDLPSEVQETLFEEILDKDVQKELEDGQIINWSVELTHSLNSRLYALWNRSAGDCLLDSVFQTTWGIFDHDGGLRRVLSESLNESSNMFYQRWKESEVLLAGLLNFSLNETQCMNDFTKLLSIAGKQGSSLEQLHIFVLAHILRRPIIVYGVKFVKSYRGDDLGFARYEGIYLPFFWEHSFCWKWPIALGYTRGHFSALVPMEPDCDPLSRIASAAQLDADDINSRSIGKEELIMSEWLDLCYTDGGIMVARQRIPKRPVLVNQMMDEWMKHYRRMCSEGSQAGYLRQSTSVTVCYSSDGESEND
ncbi:Ubiquitin thioesterase trabid [Orchesella cincta]|uniref:ubiquitinyl hydrolase 1 n=1 Tax=Orchesella cincta TaxID=48709 RepID=A0A1D2N7C2_ORCCI|nr:Ubiquitin thioesterase trabid [Orchesella cincta]